MSTQTNSLGLARQVESMFEAVLAMDLQALTKVLHPDPVVIEPASLPYGGTYTGRDTFLNDLLAQMTSGYELALENPRVIDGGTVVVGQMTCVFTSRKTGKTLKIPYVEVYESEDGLIRTVTVYPQDTKVMADFMLAESAA